jgi:hypothetical protein
MHSEDIIALGHNMAGDPIEFRVQASFKAPELLQMELSAQDGAIVERVDLAEGVTLFPLFLSVRSSNAVGTPELLTFLVTVSSSVGGKIVAELIYKWFIKTKAERLRIEKTEIVIQDGPDHLVRAVHEIIEKGAAS